MPRVARLWGALRGWGCDTAYGNEDQYLWGQGERMKMDKLSNLPARLRQIEGEHQANGRATRAALMTALKDFQQSRYRLGAALAGYKAAFRVQRGWVAAAEVIADTIGRDVKTVFRIVSDYEHAAGLPKVVIAAMEKSGIDPAARKNAVLVSNLRAMPKPVGWAEAIAAVNAAMKTTKDEKTRATLDDFAARIVKQFEDRYRATPQTERDAEVQFVFELVNASMRSSVRQLKQYSRPTLVPKPGKGKQAVA